MTRRNTISVIIICIVLNVIVPQSVYAFERKILNSVVSVLPKWTDRKQKNENTRRSKAPEGTAVAILPGGYLMTNSHVLGNATEVDIRFGNGTLIAVEIIGRDLKSDLALLKAPVDIPLLQNGSTPELASRVCAVANQFGLGLSVTCGVVSALHRTGTGFNIVEDFIQTDAVVNPGGSGGALVNDDGHLVGMLSAIFTKESDANIGINFAASIDLLMRVAPDLRDYGRVLWGNSGFRTGALKLEERRKFSGGRIIHIDQGGSAEKAGLEIGDIIIQAGGRNIIKPTDITSTIALYRPGEMIRIIFLRNKQKHNTAIMLAP